MSLSDSRWRHLDRLIYFTEPRDSRPGDDADGRFQLWRRRVFFAVFGTITLLGFFSYLPTLLAAWRDRLWLPIIGYSLVYLAGVCLVFMPRIPFFTRVVLALTAIYVAGLLNLDLAGLLGSGRVWLFFFSIITCVLLGLPYALAALALNIATFGAFYFFLEVRSPVWDGLLEAHGYPQAWLLTSNTFMVLNLVAVVSVAMLVRGLEQSLAGTRRLHEDLANKNRRMLEINTTLRREVKERRRAEDALLSLARELEAANLELRAHMGERERAEQRLQDLNRCILGFGPDPGHNINLLINLCGHVLTGDWAVYNRLEGDRLRLVGSWNAPAGYVEPDDPRGAICWDTIQLGSDTPRVVGGLSRTDYARTDPNVASLGMTTYVGIPVMAGKEAVGSLCVIYTRDVLPEARDLEFMAAVAATVAVEELRWRSEMSLRESESRMQAILETVETGIVLIEAETHRIVDLNPAAAAAIGGDRRDIVGRVCHQFICEAPQGQCPITDRNERLEKSERVLVTADGRRRDILKSATSIELDGRLHLLESFVDITDRKQAEESLRLSEEKYRGILEDMQNGYFEVDLKGDFVFFNDSVPRTLGYGRDELLGMNYRRYCDEEQARQLYEVFHDVYENGQPSVGYDWRVLRKDGETVHIRCSVSLVRDHDGRPVGFRGVTYDMTEAMKAERLTREKLRAELANQAKGQFLAHMSHEIRTPINGIMGMSELIRDTVLDEDQQRYVGIVHSEANSLLAIVNDILDFSKMEAGRLELERIPFDLGATMEELADSLAHRASHVGLVFSSYVSPDIPARLLGDPTRVRQIINNLAVNALKFTPQGEIAISAVPEAATADAVRVRFQVADTGVGIEADKLGAIFDSFTQVDTSTTRRYGGTGLGTTIAKQLVELMGGQIGVESSPGLGSTFWATLEFPLCPEEVTAPPALAPDLTGRLVLVVDDRAREREILRAHLASWGCEPWEAAGGGEALEILERMARQGQGPDLILLDTRMPGMDGFHLAARIKESGLASGETMVAMGSTASVGEARRCRLLGIGNYLTKPIKRQELQRVVCRVLGLETVGVPAASLALPSAPLIGRDGRRLRVLVVEDYPTNQQVMARYLTQAGLDFRIASDGEQALALFAADSFDLVLMDIQMPRMDGYAATRGIREMEAGGSHGGRAGSGSRTPVIALTAHAISGFRDQCLAAGMDDYLAKPFRRADLLEVIRRWAPHAAPEGRDPAAAPPPPSPSALEPALQPMDWPQAVAEFAGDAQLLGQVLAGFLEIARRQLDEMEDGLAREDWELLARHAHAIKGGSANLTARAVAEAARALEWAAKAGTPKDVDHELNALKRALAALDEFARGAAGPLDADSGRARPNPDPKP